MRFVPVLAVGPLRRTVAPWVDAGAVPPAPARTGLARSGFRIRRAPKRCPPGTGPVPSSRDLGDGGKPAASEQNVTTRRRRVAARSPDLAREKCHATSPARIRCGTGGCKNPVAPPPPTGGRSSYCARLELNRTPAYAERRRLAAQDAAGIVVEERSGDRPA